MGNYNRGAKFSWKFSWKHSLFLWVIVVLGISGTSFLVLNTKNRALGEFVLLGLFKGNFLVVVDLVLTLSFALLFVEFPELVRYIGFKRLNKKWIFISFLSGMLFVAIGELVFYTQNLIVPMPEEKLAFYEQLFSSQNWKDNLQWLAIFMLWVAPCEEVFARGFVQRGFENSLKGNVVLAIFISCLLFGVYHQDIYRILPITLETMLLGYLYYKSDHNIFAPIIAHGFGNFFDVVILAPILSSM
jgi:membrane protease YdiL (CAAX protease family)